MGSWLAALRAGAIPNTRPIVAATPNESITEKKVTPVGMSAANVTMYANEIPKIIKLSQFTSPKYSGAR